MEDHTRWAPDRKTEPSEDLDAVLDCPVSDLTVWGRVSQIIQCEQLLTLWWNTLCVPCVTSPVIRWPVLDIFVPRTNLRAQQRGTMDVGSCLTNPHVSTRSAKAKAFHEPEEWTPHKSCYYYFPNSRPPSPAGDLAAPCFRGHLPWPLAQEEWRCKTAFFEQGFVPCSSFVKEALPLKLGRALGVGKGSSEKHTF